MELQMDNKNKETLVAVNSATKKLIDDIALIIAHTNINQFNISEEKVVEVAVKQLAKKLNRLETLSRYLDLDTQEESLKTLN